MHIPDGYLSPLTCAITYAISFRTIYYTFKKGLKEVDEKKIPLLGIGSAFSFVIMMFNIPIPGGTTGHAVGGTLISILLGPCLASISIALALLVQALLFGDGGITSYGANVLAMAIIMPFSGYLIYSLLVKNSSSNKKKVFASFVSSYIAINLSAIFVAFLIGIQPIIAKDDKGIPLYSPFPLKISILSMASEHLLLFGFFEGFVTLLVISYVLKLDEKVIPKTSPDFSKRFIIIVLILAILSPVGLIIPNLVNSGSAWGEWGGEELKEIVGFVPKGLEKIENVWKAPIPDYSLTSSESFFKQSFWYATSALLGILSIAIIFLLFKFVLGRKRVE